MDGEDPIRTLSLGNNSAQYAHLISHIDAWLAYCERLHPKNIALGLDRVREVAQRLTCVSTAP